MHHLNHSNLHYTQMERCLPRNRHKAWLLTILLQVPKMEKIGWEDCLNLRKIRQKDCLFPTMQILDFVSC